MHKSPGIDAVLASLKRMEREARNWVESDLTEWRGRAELAKLAEQTRMDAARSALKSDEDKKVPAYSCV